MLSIGEGSEIKWTSPIKPKNPIEATNTSPLPIKSTVRRCLFGKPNSEPEKEELGFKKLSIIYKTNFETVSKFEKPEQFFQIRELVLEIEKILQDDPFIFDKERIREHVCALLGSKNFDLKMAEIGMVLFYLDRDGSVPEEKSLLDYRSRQIEVEVLDLIKSYEKVCSDPLIPSGKTHYLMRALVHMILTSEQAFNKGGLIAIKELLTNPKYSLSQHLQPEHRDHILSVVNQILTKSSFETLFRSKAEVHPSLADAIRLDLKLSPKDKVKSVYVFYDCLMALFADVRQTDGPNCYAIGALIYATENHPYKVITHMLTWLKQGHLMLNPSSAIPIKPLLDKRLVDSRDLEVKLEATKTLSLTPFTHISEILDLENPKERESEEAVSLKSTLGTILEASEKSKHLPYAEMLYFTYKYNTLVHMLLAISEFSFMNASPPSSTSSSPYSYEKHELIQNCLKGIERGATNRRFYTSGFMKELEGKLGEWLWFENCNEKEVNLKGWSGLTIGTESIPSFKGSVGALASVYERSLRVCCLREGKYVRLHSVSDLQKVIKEAIEETSKELGKKDWSSPGALIKATDSKQFRIVISNYASNQIWKRGIDGRDLNWADLLVFNQIGGKEDVVLENLYGIRVCKQNLSRCTTPYQFLESLLAKFEALDLRLLKATPKILIATRGSHAWTLSPHCWNLLMEHEKDFHTFIQKEVFNPAKRILSSQAPHELVERVITRYTSNPETQNEIRRHFASQRYLTYASFRNQLLDNVHRDNYSEMQRIIESEFSKVTLCKKNLSRVLANLQIGVSSETFHKLYNTLSKFPILPYHQAHALRQALIEEGVAVKDPYEVELAICKMCDRPLPINVGDLNWVHSYREDPEHIHLMIHFSWITGTPQYFLRHPDAERIESSSQYEWFQIQHPKVLIRDREW